MNDENMGMIKVYHTSDYRFAENFAKRFVKIADTDFLFCNSFN